MKTYTSFKCIGKIRDIADCYMTGIWTHAYKHDLAVEFMSLYIKNWKSGLLLDEWKRAKWLLTFWKTESNKER